MAAAKGNKYNQKYTPEDILKIVSNCIDGLLSFQSYESTTDSVTSTVVDIDDEESVVEAKEKKKCRKIEGYSCLYRALLSNGIYDQSKLHEWKKRHKDNEEVTQAINTLLHVGHQMLAINTIEGHYDPRVGQFLMERVMGYTEENAQLQNEQGQEEEEILIGYEESEDFDEWEEFEKDGIVEDFEDVEESKPDQETEPNEDKD